MAVTTQAYTISPPWTSDDFAGILRTAFIDAGWMTDWYDTFTSSTVRNRIMEITYDNTKTYGKTYYWFMLDSGNLFFHICSGWNTTSHLPAGVGGAGSQYVDWLSTATPATNDTTYHLRFAAQNTAQSITIQRYTSGTFTVLLFTNGTTTYTMTLDKTAPSSDFVDLNKELWSSLMWPNCRRTINGATFSIQTFPPRLRRSFFGKGLRGETDYLQFGAFNGATSPWEVPSANVVDSLFLNHGYGAVGNASGTTANNNTFLRPIILLPIGFNNTNPAFNPDLIEAVTGLRISPYTTTTLPSDFAVIPLYANNTTAIGDEVTVTSTEKYQVVAVANNTTINTTASIVFGARTV
jgi:hypothetical protein